MAICYCGVNFVSRSKGKNAVCKAAYNSRGVLRFEGTEFREPETFNFSRNSPVIHHEILLPKGVSEEFKDPETLWNHVEKFENRKNSQVQIEVVLALPDDPEILDEQRVELARTFAEKYFVSKGFAAQVNVHLPDSKLEIHNGDETTVISHNNHAHILITTRRFDETGKSFEKNKPRELLPQIRNGKVIDAEKWPKAWADHQNEFFQNLGIELRVDLPGAVPQIHLGPVRMRGKAQSLIEENEARKELNAYESLDAKNILNTITKHRSLFSYEAVEFYILKHVSLENQGIVREEFWKQDDIVQVFPRGRGKSDSVFSTREILREERQIFRLANRIHERGGVPLWHEKTAMSHATHLNKEQKGAFEGAVFGERLVCINGDAGTGKSTLLESIKNAYESQGYTVRGMGPDNATVHVLKEKGFQQPENIHEFLFHHANNNRNITKSKEVWIIDEASKISNPSLLELLKVSEKKRVKLIFCGDTSQFSPVERGEMFVNFCQEFGSYNLVDIQRQATQEQREIAKQWAKGNISLAIDFMARSGGLLWSENKSESIKQLVLHWAHDHKEKGGSSIVIANKKDEATVINDIIHLYRKKCGELGEKDFLCQTSTGAIVVSVGDVIEFRRNDRRIGVSNESYGVLIKAEPTQFIVRLQGQEKTRDVSFDPTSYTNFSLGYATTIFRSQGGTYDRSFILHSPSMRKDSFYVAGTRHRENVKFFISKSECPSMSTLKKLASRGRDVDSTVGYRTMEEVSKENELKKFEESGSLLQRAYGYGKEKLSNVGFLNKYVDRISDPQFYNPQIAKTPRGIVKENDEGVAIKRVITNRMFLHDAELQGGYRLVEKFEEVNPLQIAQDFNTSVGKVEVFEGRKGINIERELSDGVCVDANRISESIYNEVSRKRRVSRGKYQKALTVTQRSFQELPSKKQDILKEYFARSSEARDLYSIVCEESRSTGLHRLQVSHAKEWKKAAALRNEAAHNIMRTLSQKELNVCLSPDGFKYIKIRAEAHRESVDRRKDNGISKIEDSLKSSVEALSYKLFPEGPRYRASGTLRFGRKGSLAVRVSGNNTGTFKDFEYNVGGGMLKLIQHVNKMEFPEALKWAKDFLGYSHEIQVPTQFKAPIEKESDWVSLTPPENMLNPDIEKVNKWVAEKNMVTAHYPYRDEKGSLLFYTIRVEDKVSGCKQVLPLSYGYRKDNPSWKHWAVRGYTSEKKPIYKLESIYTYPNKPVLIVEGEKTADAAQDMLEGYVVISWVGGSGSASNADWKHLQGRDVVIWPDNDDAGFKAAESISKEMRKIGVKSLKVIDQDTLASQLPEKWDLADQIPSGVKNSFIRDAIMNANEKLIPVESLITMIDVFGSSGEGLIEKEKARDILCMVENRMRERLEKEHGGKSWEVKSNILKEASRICESKGSISTGLERRGITGYINERLVVQSMMYEAETGNKPGLSDIDNMRTALKEVGQSILPSREALDKEIDGNLKEKILIYSFDKSFYSAMNEWGCPSHFSTRIESNYRIEAETLSSEMSRKIQRDLKVCNLIEKQREKSNSIEV